jgi:hypothetical protein
MLLAYLIFYVAPTLFIIVSVLLLRSKQFRISGIIGGLYVVLSLGILATQDTDGCFGGLMRMGVAFFIVLLGMTLLPIACFVEMCIRPRYIDSYDILGTVVYKDSEGGFFAIDGDDGSKYDPISLPESFRKDGLRVKVTARLMKHGMSFHLYGSIIEVVNIARQEKQKGPGSDV